MKLRVRPQIENMVMPDSRWAKLSKNEFKWQGRGGRVVAVSMTKHGKTSMKGRGRGRMHDILVPIYRSNTMSSVHSFSAMVSKTSGKKLMIS